MNHVPFRSRSISLKTPSQLALVVSRLSLSPRVSLNLLTYIVYVYKPNIIYNHYYVNRGTLICSSRYIIHLDRSSHVAMTKNILSIRVITDHTKYRNIHFYTQQYYDDVIKGVLNTKTFHTITVP